MIKPKTLYIIDWVALIILLTVLTLVMLLTLLKVFTLAIGGKVPSTSLYYISLYLGWEIFRNTNMSDKEGTRRYPLSVN